MDRTKAEEMLFKYNQGTATEKEIAILESWYLEQGFNQPAVEAEMDYESIRNNILRKIEQNQKPVSRTNLLWQRIAIAGVITTFILGTAFFVFQNNRKRQTEAIAAHKEIIPGKQGATLTLGNGKRVRLSGALYGKLAEEAGVSITKTADGQLVYEMRGERADPNKINVLSTDVGETYILLLPDKSKVWLNAASKLTYSANLYKNGMRKVQLEGEGFFEISKDKKHPFVVETPGQKITVLGTQFNVNAYREENQIATTLLEGSVKINQATYLKPGEKSVLNGKGIAIFSANVDEETAWKNGRFSFTGKNFKSLMRTISRWYNVEIIYDYDPVSLRIAGGISRYEDINEVLQLIQETGDVKFKLEGRQVHVMK